MKRWQFLIAFGIFLAATCLVFKNLPSETNAINQWSQFWTALNGIVLIATLLVVTYYTYETHMLRQEAVRSNSLNVRPFVTLLNSTKAGWNLKNDGVGPAFNVVLYVLNNGRLEQTRWNQVVNHIRAGENQEIPDGESIQIGDVTSRHPIALKLIERLCKGESGVAVVFKDISGESFYTYYDASNKQDFGSVCEFGNLC